MNEKKALKLVQKYIYGWKNTYIQLIIACLAENCTVIEYHGPPYHGSLNIEALKNDQFLWPFFHE